MKFVDGVPRRNRVDLMTSAELAIREAVDRVETMGADARLTEVVVMLQEAKDKLSDFVDDKLVTGDGIDK